MVLFINLLGKAWLKKLMRMEALCDELLRTKLPTDECLLCGLKWCKISRHVWPTSKVTNAGPGKHGPVLRKLHLLIPTTKRIWHFLAATTNYSYSPSPPMWLAFRTQSPGCVVWCPPWCLCQVCHFCQCFSSLICSHSYSIYTEYF